MNEPIIPKSVRGASFCMYVIYDHPTDYPHSFVVRRWEIKGGKSVPDETPWSIEPSLAEARYTIPDSADCRFGRALDDDPCIVESWM